MNNIKTLKNKCLFTSAIFGRVKTCAKGYYFNDNVKW